MFDMHEAFKMLYELAKEEDKPTIIRVNVIVDSELQESISPPLDDQMLEDWFDFAATVEGIINNYCKVVNISMSTNPNSLSEYIDFYLYDSDGKQKNYLIDLRISNHKQTSDARKNRLKKVKRIDPNYRLIGIVVNDKTFHSYHDTIVYLRKLLAEESMKQFT